MLREKRPYAYVILCTYIYSMQHNEHLCTVYERMKEEGKIGLVQNGGRVGLLRNVVLNTTQLYTGNGHTCNLCTTSVPHKLSFEDLNKI